MFKTIITLSGLPLWEKLIYNTFSVHIHVLNCMYDMGGGDYIYLFLQIYLNTCIYTVQEHIVKVFI